MTTPLDKPVHRELHYQVDGRPVVAGLEILDGKPALSLRLKGQRNGWFVDLRMVADHAASIPREAGQHTQLRINTKFVDEDDVKYQETYETTKKQTPGETPEVPG